LKREYSSKVDKMKADLVIKNIKKLYTLKGPNRARIKDEMKEVGLIEDGVIAVKDDSIIYVGQGELPKDFETHENTVVIDARDKTVIPGLVDSHTHLVHSGSRENELAMKLRGAKYLEILAAGGGIHSTVEATRNATFSELYNQAKKSLDIMLSYGVTTVEAKSGYGIDDFDTELKQMEVAVKLNEDHPVDVVSTFLGAHAVPKRYKDNPDDFVRILIDDMIPEVSRRKLAVFCDVFCEEGVFDIAQTRKILEAGLQYGLIPKIHADEIEPMGGAELAAEIGCISADHLVAASERGIEMMAEKGVIANLLPGTSFYLQSGKHARARKMIDSGVPVSISTDYNPGSCPTENMQLVMSFASLLYKMTPEEVLTASTINGAASLKLENKIGSIEVGKKADILVLDSPNFDYVIYHFGINHTLYVIKNGKLVLDRQKGF